MVRLQLNLGSIDGIPANDVVGAIASQTALTRAPLARSTSSTGMHLWMSQSETSRISCKLPTANTSCAAKQSGSSWLRKANFSFIWILSPAFAGLVY
jgi:hypothetical protein